MWESTAELTRTISALGSWIPVLVFHRVPLRFSVVEQAETLAALRL